MKINKEYIPTTTKNKTKTLQLVENDWKIFQYCFPVEIEDSEKICLQNNIKIKNYFLHTTKINYEKNTLKLL